MSQQRHAHPSGEPTPVVDGDERLLRQFERRRDEGAFRSLYRRLTPRLYALAMRLTGGKGTAAEELVQEAWVRAVERLDRFGGRSTVATWLSGILINCYRERARRLRRAPSQLDPAAAEAGRSAGGNPDPRFEPLDAERALARLPDGYREVIVLHDVNGYSHREIGELLGVEEGTSKSQLARGRRRLRQLLGGEPSGRGRSEKRERS